MSFEDIELARAARAEKDTVKGKGKRGRKCKKTAPDEDEPLLQLEPKPDAEPEPESDRETEVVPAAKQSTGKRARKRTSIIEATLPEPAPVPEPGPVLELACIIPPK